MLLFLAIASYAKRPFSCCLGQGLRGLASKILPKVNTEKQKNSAQCIIVSPDDG